MPAIDGVPHLAAEEAAAALGTTPTKILILLKEKRLAGALRDGAWYVTEESLASYREEEPSRAPRCPSGCGGSGCGSHRRLGERDRQPGARD